ncbi:MAG: hypothetical protein LAN71_17690 [Acidobacteriia bacterium]|nr:hypothetical protein [Terriglobia bacterium]
MSKEHCVLLENTQRLAKAKFLDPTKVTCGVENECDGSSCVFENLTTPKVEVAKFYKKIEKSLEIMKGNGHVVYSKDLDLLKDPNFTKINHMVGS